MGKDNAAARSLANALFDPRLEFPAQPGSVELCLAYETMFGELHERLRCIIGHRGVMVLLARAILLTARQHVVLEALTATDAGVAFSALRGRAPPAAPAELRSAVSDLLTSALDDLCNLIGADLLGVVLKSAVRRDGR